MKQPPRFTPLAFLAPRYWLTWIGLGLLRLSALLPYRVLLLLGGGLGWLSYHLMPARQRIAERNLRLCMPALDDPARDALVRETFRSSGIALFEGALSWWAPDWRLRRLYRVEGLEHLRAAQRSGPDPSRPQGIILLGGHFTAMEISGRFLAFHVSTLRPTYKPAHNRLFGAVVVRARCRLFDDLIDSTDLRALLHSLKDGKVCWYAPDQDFGRERSVFAPFFGIPTATLTITARLARCAGVPVVPLYFERLPGAQGYLLRLGPALEGFPGNDDVAAAAQVNATIEAQVRRTPGQYLWLHRRFKTRPDGEPGLYE